MVRRRDRHNPSISPAPHWFIKVIGIFGLWLIAAVLTSTASAQEPDRAGKTKPCPHPQVLIAGGGTLQSGGETVLRSAELYDVATRTFATAGDMVLAREGHTATTLNPGQILLAGGYDTSFASTPTAEIYDPATGKFSPTGNMNVARIGHTATLLRDGTVLITGGFSSIDSADVASAEIYNPQGGAFELTGQMMLARENHSATLLNNGKVLITGGYDDVSRTLLQNAELYDPRIRRFFKLPGTLVAPGSQPATLLRSGRVLLVGGSDPQACCPRGANKGAEIYHPWSRSFRKTTGDMQEIRQLPTLTLLQNGQVLVAGGYPYEGELADAELYNPVSRTFTLTDNVMSSERGGHTATLLPDGSVLLAGGVAQGTQAGQIRDASPVASADLYDPQTRLFTPTQGEMSVPRAGHTANLVCSP